jgi:hypothetical protein
VEDEPQDRRDAVVRPATIRVTPRVESIQISIRTHLWMTWGEIAIDEEAKARSARDQMTLAAEERGKQGPPTCFPKSYGRPWSQSRPPLTLWTRSMGCSLTWSSSPSCGRSGG